jgi:hypothetical protein
METPVRDDRKFAVVLGMGNIGRDRFPFDYGVCVVDGDSAATSFCDLQGLSIVVGDTPCIPSIFGTSPADVTFEAEQAAVDAILAAAEEFGSKYAHGRPVGYEPLRTMIEGGIVLTVRNGRAGVELAEWVAEGAGWNIGDRIEMTVKSDGTALALHADRDGFPLGPGERLGYLGVQRDWSLPATVSIPDDDYDVAFAIGVEGVFMDMPPNPARVTALAIVPSPLRTQPTPQTTLSPRLPFDYRWSLVSLAAVCGLLSLALKFV